MRQAFAGGEEEGAALSCMRDWTGDIKRMGRRPSSARPGSAEDRGIWEESLAGDCVDSDVSTEHQNALPRPQQAPGPHPRSTTGLSLDPQPTPPRALPCPIRPFLSNPLLVAHLAPQFPNHLLVPFAPPISPKRGP